MCKTGMNEWQVNNYVARFTARCIVSLLIWDIVYVNDKCARDKMSVGVTEQTTMYLLQAVSLIKYWYHYSGVIISAMASQITSLAIVYSTVYSGADERKHQSSASLAFGRGIHRWPVNSPHKRPVTRKTFTFDDVIMHDADVTAIYICRGITVDARWYTVQLCTVLSAAQ